jgi:hypothetical protein
VKGGDNMANTFDKEDHFKGMEISYESDLECGGKFRVYGELDTEKFVKELIERLSNKRGR